jgi:hypothetical protein
MKQKLFCSASPPALDCRNARHHWAPRETVTVDLTGFRAVTFTVVGGVAISDIKFHRVPMSIDWSPHV